MQAKKGRKEENSRVSIEQRKTTSAKAQAGPKGLGFCNPNHIKHSLVTSQAWLGQTRARAGHNGARPKPLHLAKTQIPQICQHNGTSNVPLRHCT